LARAKYLLRKADLNRVEGLSNREAAEVLGVGKTTVQEARNRYREYDAIGPDWWKVVEATEEPDTEERVTLGGYSFEQKLDGTILATTKPTDEPQTLEDAYQLLVDKKVDTSGYDVSYGFVEKELASGKVTHQYTMRAVPTKNKATSALQLNADDLLRAIDRYDFTPLVTRTPNPESLVITPSDMQIGKTSFNGGTPETIERVLNSFTKAAQFATEFRPREIVIAELGDPLENFFSTSSQRETNDLDITGQIRVARRLLLDGIKQLAPYAPVIRYATVPSNHGSVRVNFKMPAGDNHNDWGLEIAAQIEDAVRENDTLHHVVFHRPEHLYESMSLETSGTTLGMVHGHQARSADKIGEWWKGQDHGRQPVANADILLVGHWHSFRVQHSGNGRWIMVSPASDAGSDWFTNITGEWSKSGMLGFTTSNGQWNNLSIF